MAAEFKFKDRIEAEEALKFRYQFDVRCRYYCACFEGPTADSRLFRVLLQVDGNGWSSVSSLPYPR